MAVVDDREGLGTLACGTVLDHFTESEELLSLVNTLPHVYMELRSREKSEERFTCETDSLLISTIDSLLVCRYSGWVPGAASSAGPPLGYGVTIEQRRDWKWE